LEVVMKLKSLLAVFLMSIAAPLACGPVAAQSSGQEPAPKLSLKLITFEGAQPAYLPVGDSEGKGGGFVVTHFRKMAFSPTPEVTAHIVGISVNYSREGDGVRMRMSVQGGVDSVMELERLAEHFIGEGEEYSVNELAGYGIEPIRLGVVRRADIKLPPPAVVNRTRSVEVMSVGLAEGGAWFKLTLRNATDKRIRLIELGTVNGNGVTDSRRSEKIGGQLVMPGETWEAGVGFEWNNTVTRAGHIPDPPDKVILSSVLFADGGYDGDVNFAARESALRLGRKLQLERVFDILREWDASSDASVRESEKSFGAKVRALDSVAPASAVEQIMSSYPALQAGDDEKMKTFIEGGMEWQQQLTLAESTRSLKLGGPRLDERAVGEWLTIRRAAYRQHLQHF
jgi:hypothetical protein